MLNLYEYISGSGAFNIPQLAPDMWNKYAEQYDKADESLDQITNVPFIDIKLQENAEMIHILDMLYK